MIREFIATTLKESGAVKRHAPVIALAGLLAGILVTSVRLHAQPYVQEIAPFEVRDAHDNPLLNPFAGGLDLTRIGLLDLEGDGYPDLFVLNLGETLRCYRNDGSAPFTLDTSSFWGQLPVRSWFRFADIDGDQAVDLFTSGERSELMLLRNAGTTSRPVFQDADTLYQKDGSVIYTEQQTVPTFVDIDGDNDLDLFSGNIDGTITYYENTGSATEASYVFRTSRFEGILVLSPAGTKEVKDPSSQSGGAHGASVLDFADLDNDGDLDMFFGDFFTQTLLYFENRGERTRPDFDTLWVDTAFAPGGDQVRSQGFNQAASGDLDRDGDLDVIVSSLLASADKAPVAIYYNEGDVNSAELRRSAIDVTSEIDVGRHAAPVILRDSERSGLLLGSEDGSLTWYEESVEDDRPTWTLSRRFVLDGVTMSSPAVGDLDGDGVAEIVVGKADAIDGGTLRLYRFADQELERVPWMLDTSANVARSNASPTLADLDGDGDLDLLVGARNGRFVLFRNTGTKTDPFFTVADPPSPFDTLDLGRNSVPRFSDIDGNGTPDLIISGEADLTTPFDTLQFWLNDGDRFSQSPDWPDMIVPTASVAFVDMMGGRRYLFAGLKVGGMLAFRDTAFIPSSVHTGTQSETPVVSVRPAVLDNGNRSLVLRWNGVASTDGAREFVMVDRLGREVYRRTLESTNGEHVLSVPALSSGMFFWSVPGTADGKILIIE